MQRSLKIISTSGRGNFRNFGSTAKLISQRKEICAHQYYTPTLGMTPVMCGLIAAAQLSRRN